MSALSEFTTSSQLTSSAAVSLARISVTRERVLAWLVRALDSGQSTLGSLASFDPDSSSWKTSQRSLLGDSPPFSGTLPLSGTMQSGYLFALLTWERRIEESDFSSWPTPQQSDGTRGQHSLSLETWERRDQACHQRGVHKQKPLVIAIKQWPTPAAADASGGRSSSPEAMARGTTQSGAKLHLTLGSAARHWPTPTVHGNHNQKGASAEAMNKNSRPLSEVATHWPTPTASMTTEGDLAQAFFRSDDPRRPPCTGGALNPTWVESIQGFPPGWTEVGPLDPPKSPGHGKRRARSKYAPTAHRD